MMSRIVFSFWSLKPGLSEYYVVAGQNIALFGFRRGFILSLGSFAGIVVGALAAFFAIPLVTGWVTTSQFRLPVILVVVAILWRFIGLYIRAWISGASVGMVDLIGMSLRKVNPVAIVNATVLVLR